MSEIPEESDDHTTSTIMDYQGSSDPDSPSNTLVLRTSQSPRRILQRRSISMPKELPRDILIRPNAE